MGSEMCIRDRDRGGMGDRGGAEEGTFEPAMALDQGIHQGPNILWLRANEVNPLLVPAHALTDVVLKLPVFGLRKAWINDLILDLGKLRFTQFVVVSRRRQCAGEPFRPVGGRYLPLDLE